LIRGLWGAQPESQAQASHGLAANAQDLLFDFQATVEPGPSRFLFDFHPRAWPNHQLLPTITKIRRHKHRESQAKKKRNPQA
jgi:hypothetical protein